MLCGFADEGVGSAIFVRNSSNMEELMIPRKGTQL